jgi:hypothetical protein
MAAERTCPYGAAGYILGGVAVEAEDSRVAVGAEEAIGTAQVVGDMQQALRLD